MRRSSTRATRRQSEVDRARASRELAEREGAAAAAYRLLADTRAGQRTRGELNQLAHLLAQLSYFSEPGRRAMLTGELMQLMEVSKVSAGTAIVRQGEHGSLFHVLLEGCCSVHIKSEERSPARRSSLTLSGAAAAAASGVPTLLQRQSAQPQKQGSFRMQGSGAVGATVRNLVTDLVRQASASQPESLGFDVLLGPSVGLVRTGDAFGEKSALMDTQRTASVLAVSECSLLTIDQKSFFGSGTAGHYLGLLQQKLKFLAELQLEVPPRLAYAFRERAFLPGEWLLQPGEPVEELVLLCAGRASLHPRHDAALASHRRAQQLGQPPPPLGLVCAGGCVGDEALLSGAHWRPPAGARRGARDREGEEEGEEGEGGEEAMAEHGGAEAAAAAFGVCACDHVSAVLVAPADLLRLPRRSRVAFTAAAALRHAHRLELQQLQVARDATLLEVARREARAQCGGSAVGGLPLAAMQVIVYGKPAHDGARAARHRAERRHLSPEHTARRRDLNGALALPPPPGRRPHSASAPRLGPPRAALGQKGDALPGGGAAARLAAFHRTHHSSLARVSSADARRVVRAVQACPEGTAPAELARRMAEHGERAVANPMLQGVPQEVRARAAIDAYRVSTASPLGRASPRHSAATVEEEGWVVF